LSHDSRKNREGTTQPREDRCYPLSHRSHPCLRVRRLLCERRSQRASCASVLSGQGNIGHEMALVKKVCAHFCSSNVARTVAPLQAAPTEVQRPNCPMLSAKITRRDSDARPCSRVCNRCADGEPRRPSDTTGTTNYGARAAQKCQLRGVVPPKMPARHWNRRTREKSIRCSKIRTRCATGLRKQRKNWTNVDQRRKPVGQTFLSARDIHLEWQTRMSAPRVPRAHKKRRPFASGHGLRGGRWPGPQVERDGLNCYCSRGWVSDRSYNSMAAAISLGGIAATGIGSLTSLTRPASDRFIRAQKSFLMAILAAKPLGHGRRP
jgi:hypothetical protein